MKAKFFTVAIIIFLSIFLCAQGISINATGAAADASSILDVSSNNQGLLLPRMTKDERIAISSPAIGLLVFQTDGIQGFYFYSGSEWNLIGSFHPKAEIGDFYEGGIVFYVDGTGQHGLIAAQSDQSTNISWNDGVDILTGATMDGIGAGAINTNLIISAIGDGPHGDYNYAAKLCGQLILEGYSDWYLPSKNELVLMYQQRMIIGLSTQSYWSSNEYDEHSAWVIHGSPGGPIQNTTPKVHTERVRAIRAF